MDEKIEKRKSLPWFLPKFSRILVIARYLVNFCHCASQQQWQQKQQQQI